MVKKGKGREKEGGKITVSLLLKSSTLKIFKKSLFRLELPLFLYIILSGGTNIDYTPRDRSENL